MHSADGPCGDATAASRPIEGEEATVDRTISKSLEARQAGRVLVFRNTRLTPDVTAENDFLEEAKIPAKGHPDLVGIAEFVVDELLK